MNATKPTAVIAGHKPLFVQPMMFSRPGAVMRVKESARPVRSGVEARYAVACEGT